MLEMNPEAQTEREKIAARIKALLSKTIENGCSEGEAHAAMLKARELMDKYYIDMTAVEFEAEGVVEYQATGDAGHRFNVQDWMVSAIAKFTDCKTWSSMRWIEDEGERQKRWIFLGLDSDTEFANWLLVSLEDFVWAKADNYACEEAANKGYLERKTFAYGCAVRISERLREEARKRENEHVSNMGDGRSLVLVKNALVEKEFKAMNLRLVRGRGGSGRMGSGDAYNAGRKAGDSAGFGRPVNGSGGTKLLS